MFAFRKTAAAVALLVIPLSAAACSSPNPSGANPSGSAAAPSSSAPASSAPASSPSASASEAADTPFGAACSKVPTSGKGSFDGMSKEPVATAASANPLLTTLVKAVGAAGLADTLNTTDDITVFAPTDDAFKAMDQDTLGKAMKDKKLLTTVLTYHVVPGRLAPDEVAGKHETLQGGTVEVKGSGEDFTVGPKATVLCGNVQTANATVYIIDQVLLPAS